MNQQTRLFQVDPWNIRTTTLDKTNRRLQESLTSIGNGYMGMRGNFEETYSGDHHQGTYLAGVWYPDKTRVGWWKNGYPDYFGKVINAVDFLKMTIYLDDELLDLYTADIENFLLELNLEQGILRRHFTVKTAKAQVRFEFERFLSLERQELAVIQLKVTLLQGSATLRIASSVTHQVRNEDSHYDEEFWQQKAAFFEQKFGYVTAQTTENPFGIERFTVTSGVAHETTSHGTRTEESLPGEVLTHFTHELGPDEPFTLEKRVILVTSRDIAADQQPQTVQNLLTEANATTYEALRNEQIAAWKKRWALADVRISGDAAAQQGIRFNLFQLFATYYGEDARLNIGPKGFTGEKYGGATYWDTEAYAVPLYLALADPSVTKNLLTYRHNQLPQAKINAQKQGLAGALYPMVTFTGIECHNEWEITFEEIHRNGAIAYAIYNYTNYTGDTSYLAHEGLEVLVEIARFWADRVHYAPAKDRYMIHGVTGPNEYENNSNNNWYTNTIAAWVLRYTAENYQTYGSDCAIAVTEAEREQWVTISDKMYLPYDAERKIFVQQDTFLDKELRPVTDLAPEELPLNQHWSWDKILRSCFIKQADVLQGIYFFNDQYTREEKARNFDFYEPLTVHESSLSPSIHAILAAELGYEDKAVEMYQRTARLDLDNYNNDTEDGLHITSMTGSWLAIVQGFAQMKTAKNQLSFAPFLPSDWDDYAFHINYRERLLHITVNQSGVTLTLLKGEPLELSLFDEGILLDDTLTKPFPQIAITKG